MRHSPSLCSNFLHAFPPPAAGRKLRYNVIEKLVNFMAPDEAAHPSSDQARDDLFASLFQGE